MKSEINLLPPPALKFRALRVYLVHSGQLLRLMIGLLLVVVALQLGGAATYRWLEQESSAAAGIDEATTTSLASTVRQHNDAIRLAKTWFASRPSWTPLLRSVFRAIPPAIELTDVRVNERDDSLVLTGKVSTRDDVIALQRVLEQLDWAAEVKAPLSNFQTGDNTTFSFTIIRQPMESL